MKTLKLKAEKRVTLGKKVNKFRNEGKIPAVLYGKKIESKSILIDRKEFDKIYKEAGESSLVDLEIGDENNKVLISETQYHPVTGEHIHVDFHQVNLREKVKADIPVEYENEEIAPAVKEQEGTLVKEKDTIEVECLPTEIPHSVKVDVSVLKTFDDMIRVSDLKLPEGVEILNDPEEVVALVKPPRSEEEIEALDEEVVEDVDKVETDQKETEEDAEESKEDTKEVSDKENKDSKE